MCALVERVMQVTRPIWVGVFSLRSMIFSSLKMILTKIKIFYSSEQERTLRVVSRDSNNGTQTGLISQQVFPSTGGNSGWNFLEMDIPFSAGESNSLRVIALEDQGVQLIGFMLLSSALHSGLNLLRQ